MGWVSIGASVPGPAHLWAGTPCQDAWLPFSYHGGIGIAVADGLGSKSMSGFGSRTACRAVAATISAWATKTPSHDAVSEIPALILENWLTLVQPFDSRDAATTCLYAFRAHTGMLHLGVLGDGCAAVVSTDRSVQLLMATKDDGFANFTDALAPNTQTWQWNLAAVSESEVTAIVLCTDGIADDLVDAPGFMLELADVITANPGLIATSVLFEMLKNWPVPKHRDDKTIACLYRELP